MQTPVAFLVFNRPETTRLVFQAIRRAQPSRLLLIGDGARPDVAGEADRVRQVRKVISEVDWPCDVQSNFSDVNLGCKARVATGLDWAFSHAESLIILEDDCLPDPTFFTFCESMLARYRDDERVMMISGDNFQSESDQRNAVSSYYFSRWTHIWGWASWRRAWRHFDVDVSTWPENKMSESLRHWFDSDEEYLHWVATLDRQHRGEIDTWDFPWQYACWAHQGMTILPSVNLVSNVGFGPDATHTTDAASKLARLPVQPMHGPLIHPNSVELNRTADAKTWRSVFRPQPSHAPVVDPRPRKRHWLKRLISGAG